MKPKLNLARRSALGATAIVAAAFISLGAAAAAHAETPPDSQPGQVVTDWDPASGGLWGTGTGGQNGGGTGIDWVAQTFTYEGTNTVGYDSYTRSDGTVASSGDVSRLGAAMGYDSGCSTVYGSTEIVCH